MKVKYDPMDTCKQRQKKIAKRIKYLHKLEMKIIKEEEREMGV